MSGIDPLALRVSVARMEEPIDAGWREFVGILRVEWDSPDGVFVVLHALDETGMSIDWGSLDTRLGVLGAFVAQHYDAAVRRGAHP